MLDLNQLDKRVDLDIEGFRNNKSQSFPELEAIEREFFVEVPIQLVIDFHDTNLHQLSFFGLGWQSEEWLNIVVKS